jgi:hypothetical protein
VRLVSPRVALFGLAAFSLVLLVYFLLGAQHAATPAQHENVGAEGGKASTDTRANGLINKELQTWELEKKKDKSGYAALIAPHFLAITDRGLMSTAQNLQEIDDMTVETYSTSNFKVNFLTEDVALLTYRAKWKGLYKEMPFDESNYSAALWVRHGDEWLDEYYQETIIHPPAQPEVDPPKDDRVNAIAEREAPRKRQVTSESFVANELVAKETKTWALAKKKDKFSYGALLGDDFLAVSPYGSLNKEQNVADLDNLRIDDYSIVDLNVAQIVPEVALITYRVKSKGVYRGEAFESANYAASVWTKRDGQWLNVFLQETAAPTN